MTADATSPRPPGPAPSVRVRTLPTLAALLVATLGFGLLAAALAVRVRTLIPSGGVPLKVDSAVEAAVTGVGALVAMWLAGSALVAAGCLLVRMAGTTWRTGERFVHRCAPGVVRRALVVVVGASVGLGVATGASAATPAPNPGPSVSAAPTPGSRTSATVTPPDADDLGWPITSPGSSPTPSVTSTAPVPSMYPVGSGSLASAEPVATTPPAPAADSNPSAEPSAAHATGATTVTVVAGDSLWAIAARHLSPDATDAQIAAEWPRWWHANAAVVGRDPDTIRPGQVLSAPASDGATS